MIIRSFFILITIILTLTGCAQFPNENYADPLFCEQDDDCQLQFTRCIDCECPQSINIYHYENVDCPEEEIECDLYCEVMEPKCRDNRCVQVDPEY